MVYGLYFRNIDLHVHTPASNCFLDKAVTPEQIVQYAIDENLSAIAITDHNTAAWVDKVKEAAKESELVVFPGVEITVHPGIHIVAIFPTSATGEHVTDLLAELKLGVDVRGDPKALVMESIESVTSSIRKHGALAVLAHIDAPKGFWNELSGQTRIQHWDPIYFDAVELIGENLPDGIGEKPFMHKPAYYWASDNPDPDEPTKHSIKGIGSRFSCFKLEYPITREGLRNCFSDPKTRIRSGNPDQLIPEFPVIQKIKISGGFLSDFEIDPVNPNLNCVIGGRGTGKSSLFEIIRYAFDIEAKTEENQRQSKSIIENVFPAGSLVQIDYKLTDGNSYRIERRANQDPEVYRLPEKELTEIKPSQLLPEQPIQVYGQKEIYEISRDPTFQLNLLDNYIADELENIQQQESDVLRKLKENATKILQLEEEIDSAQEWLSRLGSIQEELRRMENQGFIARIEKKKLYDQEERWLTRAQKYVDDLLSTINDFQETNRYIADNFPEISQDHPNKKLLEKQQELLEKIDDIIVIETNDLKTKISDIWNEGEKPRDKWLKEYKEQDRSYQELLEEFQGEGDVDRYIQLQQTRSDLEERDKLVKHKKNEVSSFRKNRSILLDQLRNIRRDKYKIRCEKAENLTNALSKKVRITLHPQGNRDSYKEYLQKLFAGLNVRNPYRDRLAEVETEKPEREAQRPVEVRGETRYLISRIPLYFDPIDLAEAIRNEQVRMDNQDSLLEQRFGIDSENMRRNISTVSEEQLFDLEIYEVPDYPIIELQVSSGDIGYRELRYLSVGQKCTALLSLVLLESNVPLIIDQPEDDLDNQFIFDQIVATLREEKEKRQFIIATHNANIPVSGDSELIIVLHADESKGWANEEDIGSIDNENIKRSVETILEGGKQAFILRKEKYGIT